MFISRTGYHWNNVMSPNWWVCNRVGLQPGFYGMRYIPHSTGTLDRVWFLASLPGTGYLILGESVLSRV